MGTQNQVHLSEFHLHNIILLAIDRFTQEVTETGTTDWEAFDTLIVNIRAYTASFSNDEYLAAIKTAMYNFVNFCETQGVLDAPRCATYISRIRNQFSTVMKEHEEITQLAFLIRNLYTSDTMFTADNKIDKYSFETIAMLLDLPQRLVRFINSESFRNDLFEATCKAHAMYVTTPSTVNGARYTDYLRILYIIGLLEQDVNDSWISDVEENTDEFRRQLAELLGIDLNGEYTNVFGS